MNRQLFNCRKMVAIAICFVSINVFANDTIRITIQAESTYRSAKFFIGSTVGEEFSIDWGAGKEPVTYKQVSNIGKSAEYKYANTGTYEITIIPTEACSITRLDCCIEEYTNKLISIELGNNTTLETLNCNYNELTSLDISGCTVLQFLYCNDNRLKNLDVSKNANLTTLHCGNNQLSNLELNKNLEELSCSNNELATLDLRECTALTKLYCSDNQLNNLDVSKNTKLTHLDCQANQLTSLDLSVHTELRELFCNSNLLSSLDLSNIRLQNLSCSNNKLTNLAIWSVQNLSCSNNHLPLSNLYEVSQKSIQKVLGTQKLMPQTVSIGKVLFSEQSIFNEKYTKYAVMKNDNPAPASDYSADNGKITFNSLGNYIVTMTNEAVDLSGAFRAEVIAELEVVESTGLSNIKSTGFNIYPNPTTGLVYTETESAIKVYNLQGTLLYEIFDTQVDLSNHPNGIYLLQTDGKMAKIVKQ